MEPVTPLNVVAPQVAILKAEGATEPSQGSEVAVATADYKIDRPRAWRLPSLAARIDNKPPQRIGVASSDEKAL